MTGDKKDKDTHMHDVESLAIMVEDIKRSMAVNRKETDSLNEMDKTPIVRKSILEEVDKLNECVRLSLKY
ncbi:MAG: hypothetical protein NTY09_11795 [bacterium]|nr:hypothetical protein [bacterium]